MQRMMVVRFMIDGSIPKYPIFNGITDPIVRALLAMIVGCNACPGGAKGSGCNGFTLKVFKRLWSKLTQLSCYQNGQTKK